MSTLKKFSQKKYDVVIFGSNLSSYLLAATLEQKLRLSVCLLENKQIHNPSSQCYFQDPYFSHLPVGEATTLKELNAFISELVQNTYISSDDVPLSTSTVESGKISPFLGFSEKKFSSQNLVSDLVPIHGHRLSLTSIELIHQLRSTLNGDLHPLAQVTDLAIDETSGEIHHAIVNGDQKLQADIYVSGLGAEASIKLLPAKLLPAKNLQKIAKLKSWAQIDLFCELPQGEPSIPDNQYILMGQKSDFEPCFGEVFQRNERRFSRFSSLVSDEFVNDHEHLGALMRFMKRQIKRLDPNFFDRALSERVVVQNSAEAFADLRLQEGTFFPQIPRLFFCHPNWRPESGLTAELKATHKALDCLSQLQAAGTLCKNIKTSSLERNPSTTTLNP